MVVNDFNPFWTSVAPPEADTPLIVDSDTVLARTITAQTLEPVARRNPEILQTARSVNLTQLAQYNAHDARIEGRNRLPRRQPLGLAIPERLDHANMIYRIALLTQTVNLHCPHTHFPACQTTGNSEAGPRSRDPATASSPRTLPSPRITMYQTLVTYPINGGLRAFQPTAPITLRKNGPGEQYRATGRAHLSQCL